MEVNFTPEVQAKLDRLAEVSGCRSEELVQDAVTGMVADLARTREMLDGRYDDLDSGQVELIDGEEAFRLLMEKSEAQPRRQRSA